MVVLSKIQFFRDFPMLETCHPLHFTGTQSCFKNALLSFINAAFACSKYYIPVYILQLLLIGVKNLNREKVIGIILSYLRSIIYGGTFPLTISGSLCFSRALFGKIDIRAFFLLCLMLGGTIFCESTRNRHLNTYMVCTMTMEIMVNELESNNWITRSPIRDTLKFMAVNGLVMYFLAQEKLKSLNFWFYDIKPIEENPINENRIIAHHCTNKNICLGYLKDGFQKYFVIGYGWNIVKLLMKQSTKLLKTPSSITTISTYLLKLENFKFGSVLGLYAVIYRYIMCNLMKIDSVHGAHQRAMHSGLAGVLAGSTYIIEPNLQFGLTALVTLLQIFYEKTKKSTFTESVWKKIPSVEISFLLAVSYAHVCFMCNSTAFHRTNSKFLYDTFSGHIASKLQAVLFRQMNLI